jgi:endonuclease YncB( thermonuclease family)
VLAIVVAVVGLWYRNQQMSDPTLLQGPARLSDGDSLAIDKARIRLQGIDAPELDQSCERAGRNWPCGKAARETLQRLIGGQDVACESVERDRHGRHLARCRTIRIADLNKAMVMEGMALAYGAYESEEQEARRAKRGLWAGSFERPRAWRDKNLRR